MRRKKRWSDTEQLRQAGLNVREIALARVHQNINVLPEQARAEAQALIDSYIKLHGLYPHQWRKVKRLQNLTNQELRMLKRDKRADGLQCNRKAQEQAELEILANIPERMK